MTANAQAGITRLEHATTTGVLALAVGSFVLSYDALHQLAVTNHVPRPLAWIWPLIVDGFIITASLAILHTVLRGRSAHYPWLLLIAFSAMSVAFNVLHAPPTPVARLVAAIPPLTLVLSFELLMRQLRDRLSARPSTAPILLKAPATTEATSSEQQPPPAAAPHAGAPTRTGVAAKAREIHHQHLGAGTKLTGRTLADMLGISDGYARRLLREITSSQPSA